MQWLKVQVRVHHEAQEAAAQILFDMGAKGVQFDEDGAERILTVHWPAARAEEVDDLAARVRGLAAFGLNPGSARVLTAWVDDEDWAENWKRHYEPLEVSRRLLVMPAWLETPATDRHVILLDPGMAFGTGYHPTTALCLRAIDDVVQQGDVVADIGTGSGILAIGAAHLGASRVVAVDTEIEAVEATRENCARNGVEHIVTIAKGSTERTKAMLGAGDTGRATADVVVINILARVIVRLAEDLFSLVRPGGTIIASGIIEHACEDVVARLQAVGFTVTKETTEGEWCCLIARRPG